MENNKTNTETNSDNNKKSAEKEVTFEKRIDILQAEEVTPVSKFDWCKVHSLLEKCLCFVLLVVVAAIITLFVLLFISKGKKTCETPQCIAATAELLQSTDFYQSPCEDFFTFTCSINILNNASELTLHDDYQNTLNNILYEKITNFDSNCVQAQKTFYASCMNMNAIDLDNDKRFLEILDRLGGWPLTKGKNWNYNQFENWADLIVQLRKAGFKYNWIIDFKVVVDNSSNINILKLARPKLNSTTFEDKKYVDLISNIGRLWSSTNGFSQHEIERTIAFEKDFNEELKSSYNETLENDVTLTLKELGYIIPTINWNNFISKITDRNCKESDLILVESLSFLKKLNRLLSKTQLRILSDYLIWNIVQDLKPFLSWKVRSKFETYHKEMTNITVSTRPENRKGFCLRSSRKEFPLFLETEFIRRNRIQKNVEIIKDMVSNIKNQFIKVVNESQVIKMQDKTQIILTLKNMKEIIGGPSVIADYYTLEDFLGYNELKFSSNNIIDIILDKTKNHNWFEFRSLYTTLENQEELSLFNFSAVYPYYVKEKNYLVIPQRILQDDFYNVERPNYLNYASVGVILAQLLVNEQIIKGPPRWDALESEINVKIEHNCNIRSNTTDRGFSSFFHNPVEDINEFSSTFIGIDLAYQTYLKRVAKYGKEYILPSFQQSTAEQLFWIEATKIMCKKYSVNKSKEHLKNRVTLPLRNNKYFSQDFNCPEHSFMNKKEKCVVI